MPDFNPKRPQATREPNRPNRLRSVLMANWLRTAWIGVGIFFFVMVVVPGGLLIYQSSGVSDQLSQLLADKQAAQQDDIPEIVTCEEEELRESGECIAPSSANDSIVCEAKVRALVEEQEYCRKGPNDPYPDVGPTVTCDAEYLVYTDACIGPGDANDYIVCEAESRALVRKQGYCRKGNDALEVGGLDDGS